MTAKGEEAGEGFLLLPRGFHGSNAHPRRCALGPRQRPRSLALTALTRLALEASEAAAAARRAVADARVAALRVRVCGGGASWDVHPRCVRGARPQAAGETFDVREHGHTFVARTGWVQKSAARGVSTQTAGGCSSRHAPAIWRFVRADIRVRPPSLKTQAPAVDGVTRSVPVAVAHRAARAAPGRGHEHAHADKQARA